MTGFLVCELYFCTSVHVVWNAVQIPLQLHCKSCLRTGSDRNRQYLTSSATTTLLHFHHLPQSLTSLEALAHMPTLAVCSPAPKCTVAQGTSDDRPVLTLCLATNATDEETEDVTPADGPADHLSATSEHGGVGASMWLQRAVITPENVSSGLYTLHSRRGVVACCLQAKTANSFQGITIFLPRSSCLFLGSSTLNFQDATFEGVQQSAFCYQAAVLISRPYLVNPSYKLNGNASSYAEQWLFKLMLLCRRSCGVLKGQLQCHTR